MRMLAVLLAVVFGMNVSLSGEAAKPAGYPVKPIEIIVPFAPGGGMDVSVRLLAGYAGEELGEKIRVVNLTRGGNIQGNLEGIRAAPDGYVLGCWGTGLVTDQLMVRNAPYTHKDVEPVCMYARDPHLIVVSAEFAERTGVRTLEALLRHIGENPGMVVFGAGGNWTSHDFLRLKLEAAAGEKFARMPFLGGAPALRAALEGNCDVVTPFPSEFMPYAESDAVIVLAVASESRLRMLPDIPATKELGYPSFVQGIWRVIAAPKGTPQRIIDYLAAVFHRAVENGDFVSEAGKAGITPVFMAGDELKDFIEEEYEAFVDLTGELGIGAVPQKESVTE